MLRSAAIQLAYLRPELRPYLLPLLVGKTAEEGGGEDRLPGSKVGTNRQSADWKTFWKQYADNGKKKVTNPNPDTRKTYPEVSANTAMRDPSYSKKVMEDFKKWSGKDGESDKGKSKDTGDKKEKGKEKAAPKPLRTEDREELESRASRAEQTLLSEFSSSTQNRTISPSSMGRVRSVIKDLKIVVEKAKEHGLGGFPDVPDPSEFEGAEYRHLYDLTALARKIGDKVWE